MKGDPKTLLVESLRGCDPLDDLTRKRMWSRLEDRLAKPAAGGAGAARSARGRAVAIGAAAVAFAATLAIIVAARHRGERADDAAPRAVVAADSTLTTKLGPHTRAALVGPADYAIVGAAGDATEVSLARGTLVAEFTGGPGRSLRVAAPGMTVDIVGTLFAVDVDTTRTCVSVSHGRVRATTAAGIVFVGAGERACSDTPPTAPLPIDPRVRQLLDGAVLESKVAAAPKAESAPPIATPTAIVTPPTSVAVAPVVPVRPPVVAPPTPMSQTITTEAAATKIVDPFVATAPKPADPKPTDANANASAGSDSGSGSGSATANDPAEALYEAAEAALARHDTAAADRALASLVATQPHSALVDQAIFERARIAYQRHAWDEARRQLAALAALSSPLAESGRYLGCRIAVDTHDGDAPRCLADFRAAYPHSAHDLDALATLAQLATDCTHARAYVVELGARYPKAAATRAWQEHCK